MSRLRPALQVPILALRGAIFEWRLVACYVFGLVAVLVPVMLTGGLRYGVINGLLDRLNADPRNLEIVIVGNYRLGPDWFAGIEQTGLASFIVPTTRSLSATVTLMAGGADRRMASAVQLIPTGSGDPLIGDNPPPTTSDTTVLSASVAKELGLAVGETITLIAARRLNGVSELGKWPIEIIGIAPAGLVQQDVAFVTLDVLVGTEDFRDGTLPELKIVDGMAGNDREFASARVFAKNIDQVPALAKMAEGTGLSVRTRSQEIQTVKLLDKSLSTAFAIIATVGGGGYLLSVMASQWANLERRRRDLSILRLIGITKIGVLMLPVIEAGLIATLGFAISTIAFFAVAHVLNWMFAATFLVEGAICQLGWLQIVAIGAITLVVAAFAAFIGGFNVVRIDPGESLRAV
jgi:putative ABC transport system permease protein